VTKFPKAPINGTTIPALDFHVKPRLSSPDYASQTLRPAIKMPIGSSPNGLGKLKLEAISQRHAPRTSYGSHQSALSHKLQDKVIDAVSVDQSYPRTQKEIRKIYLTNPLKVKPKSKPSSKTSDTMTQFMRFEASKPIQFKVSKPVSSKRGVKTTYYTNGASSSLSSHAYAPQNFSSTLK